MTTKISELTVGELLDLIERSVAMATAPAPETVSGIAGIAKIFGVSESTAKRIKASGVIDKAISQSGRTIVTDVKTALALYHSATHGRSRIGYK